jgi:hypothetical protein
MEGAGSQHARLVLSPDKGKMVVIGRLGAPFMLGGAESRGTFALVEHPIGPRVLAAPLHTHEHEDEYTYVLEGEVGVQVAGMRCASSCQEISSSSLDACLTPSGTRAMRQRGRWVSSPPQASSGTSRRSHLSSPTTAPAYPILKRSAPSWPGTEWRWTSAPSRCSWSATGP